MQIRLVRKIPKGIGSIERAATLYENDGVILGLLERTQ